MAKDRGAGGDFVDWWARDADFAWATWSLGAEGVQAAQARLGLHGAAAALVLRVYHQAPREGGGPPMRRALDLELDRWVGGRLVPLGAPGAEHLCTLGVVARGDRGGFFVPIVRSQPLIAPRATPGAGAVAWEEVG
jgi:hypothetical protein